MQSFLFARSPLTIIDIRQENQSMIKNLKSGAMPGQCCCLLHRIHRWNFKNLLSHSFRYTYRSRLNCVLH